MNFLGVNLRVNNIFKPTSEMIESLKLPSSNPSNIPPTIPEESAATNGLRNTENIQNDPFSSTNGTVRDRDLAFNNHPSFYNRLNEGLGNIGELETPTAQSSNPASHDMLGGGNMNTIPDKPPPVRKTRATTTEITTRKLSSRTRDDNAKRSTTAAPSQDSSATAAPARRSTRLTSKFTSKLGVGTERETRLGTKEREREAKKMKSVGSRSRSLHLSGTTAAAKERERDKGNSEDVNVRNGSFTTISFEITESKPQRPTRATTTAITKRKQMASADSSLTQMRKKQMTDVAAASKPTAQAAPLKPLTDSNKEEAMLFVLDLFRKLGSGYFSLSRFYCKEALQAFSSLPAGQRETPWVQSKIGRAHYEMANYVEVCRPFFR